MRKHWIIVTIALGLLLMASVWLVTRYIAAKRALASFRTVTLVVGDDFSGCIRILRGPPNGTLPQSIVIAVPDDGNVTADTRWISEWHALKIVRKNGVEIQLLTNHSSSHSLRTNQAHHREECWGNDVAWATFVR